MKRILFAAMVAVSGLAGVFSTGAALAGSSQPPVIEPALTPAPAPDVVDWSGIYVGGVVGTQNGTLEDFALPQTYQLGEGINGGLLLGVNGQTGAFVFSGELAIQTGSFNLYPPPGPGSTPWTTDYLVDVRGRVGYAFDSVLLYAAAGVSKSMISGDVVPRSGTASGWNVGAGLDYAVTDDIFIGGEYVFRDLNGTNNVAAPYETKKHGVQVRAGYRF